MPRRELNQLSDAAQLWVFPVSPAVEGVQRDHLLDVVDRFLDQWAAHGAPVISGRALVEGSLLLVAADKGSETSGCSIDRMFGTLKQLEGALGVSILDSNRILYRDRSGTVRAATRAGFRDTVAAGEVDSGSIVFDPLIETLGSFRRGELEKRAADSWHGAAYGLDRVVAGPG
jgi:hypothetical protein